MTKILVIDDDAVVRDVIGEMLLGAGYEVVDRSHGGRGAGALHGR